MNKDSVDYKEAVKLGEQLVGKKAQSRLLTEISASGKMVLQAPQIIAGYEIVENFMEPDLMVNIGDTQIFADLLININ